MKIKSIAILGAGAIGSYLLYGLSEKKDIDLFVVADGERKERYEKNGFIINGETYHPEIKTPSEAHGVDLLLVSLKYDALNNSLTDIKAIVGENTTVMSLMNGVDSEEIIASAIGKEKIVYSLIKVASHRVGNSTNFDGPSTVGIILGEADPNMPKDRIEAITEAFGGCKLHFHTSEHILSELWNKYRLNVSNNLIQAIVGVGVGAYTDSEHMAFLKKKMAEEVLAVAKAKGIDMSLVDTTSAVGTPAKPTARYSTLQDIDAKRHTEIEMFSGAMVRMGKELGVPTPFNEMTYHLIKAIEEKNDGKFDY